MECKAMALGADEGAGVGCSRLHLGTAPALHGRSRMPCFKSGALLVFCPDSAGPLLCHPPSAPRVRPHVEQAAGAFTGGGLQGWAEQTGRRGAVGSAVDGAVAAHKLRFQSRNARCVTAPAIMSS